MPLENQTQRQIRGLQTQITTLSTDLRGVRNAVEEIRQQNNQLMTLVNQLIEQRAPPRPQPALSSSSSSSCSSSVAVVASPPPGNRGRPATPDPADSPVYEPGSPDWSPPPPPPPNPPYMLFMPPPPPFPGVSRWVFGHEGIYLAPEPSAAAPAPRPEE